MRREIRLDDVHLEAGELVGDLEFFRAVQVDSRGLFAVPQRGVENAYEILAHLLSDSFPAKALLRSGASRKRRRNAVPQSSGADLASIQGIILRSSAPTFSME